MVWLLLVDMFTGSFWLVSVEVILRSILLPIGVERFCCKSVLFGRGRRQKPVDWYQIFVVVLHVEPYVPLIFRAPYYSNGRRSIARDGGPLHFDFFLSS